MLPYPEAHEISAAGLLARFFQDNVLFIKRTADKTADIRVSGIDWEMKSPTGKGKYKLLDKLCREVERQFHLSNSLKRLILIKKDGQILAFSKKVCYNVTTEGSGSVGLHKSEFSIFGVTHNASLGRHILPVTEVDINRTVSRDFHG